MSRRGEAAHRRQNRQAGRLLGLRPFIAGGSEAGAARRNALGLSIIDRPQER
jgi:hypothetical protein